MRQVILDNPGWQTYLQLRFKDTAKGDEIRVEPHQVDGLSFSMTLVILLKHFKLTNQKALNVVVMGGSEKAEERIFAQTNYFEELTHFYPDIDFTFYFAGPELSSKRNFKQHQVNNHLRASFYKGTVMEFLLDLGLE